MIQLTLKLTGIYAAAAKTDVEGLVASQAQTCLRDAVQQWIAGRQSPSLRDRFGPNAYGTYGFTRRVPSYEKAQKRVLGAAQPYASPRGLNFMRAALAIARGAGNPAQIARHALRLATEARALYRGAPMRTAVFRPGGHTIRVGGKQKIQVRLALPGARNLNRGGAKSAVYKRELLDFNRGAQRDRTFIYRRTEELMRERIWRALNNHRSVTVVRAA